MLPIAATRCLTDRESVPDDSLVTTGQDEQRAAVTALLTEAELQGTRAGGTLLRGRPGRTVVEKIWKAQS